MRDDSKQRVAALWGFTSLGRSVVLTKGPSLPFGDMMSRLEKRSRLFWAILISVLVIAVGALDVLTGYEVSFSLFYLLPISLASWFSGKRSGIVASVISAFTWFAADAVAGDSYSHPAIAYWNTAVRFGFFIIVTWLISTVRELLDHEREMARIDSLTGAINARSFSELLQVELYRCQRYKRPFTLSYIDIDDFKPINDRFGHSIGDIVLYTTVQRARSQLRKVDIVARLGGDEFAFLLPETDQAAAQIIISRIRTALLDEMQRNNWPVTYSMGVLTCLDKTPETADALIKQADDAMYSVKNKGKNSVSYSVYAG